ncbi:DUF805 domain-containing protein [Alkalicoccus daliensis]|uniref:Uncharacterized membrane protein YhaH, DUF805 family n=1 Tax=Alkalicoccus daliensis TaxID=745820 RepID=A0A1H0DRE8_9BACI|nr:DUF805 domain-containing protein [Alkalicoccus daliensis]SDN72735.1 Uncharacterized membrane protein YhaH, DUF805 family [Alkalicoccus daliensis]
MQWYLKVIQNYANFQGRARRMEYWMFYLVNFLIVSALGILETFIGLPTIISGIYSLFVLIPSIAVAVRRMHDTGRSGLWVLIYLIPIIGWIIFIILALADSERSANKYGPSPKY